VASGEKRVGRLQERSFGSLRSLRMVAIGLNFANPYATVAKRRFNSLTDRMSLFD
jgi:hypothetical protein